PCGGAHYRSRECLCSVASSTRAPHQTPRGQAPRLHVPPNQPPFEPRMTDSRTRNPYSVVKCAPQHWPLSARTSTCTCPCTPKFSAVKSAGRSSNGPLAASVMRVLPGALPAMRRSFDRPPTALGSKNRNPRDVVFQL